MRPPLTGSLFVCYPRLFESTCCVSMQAVRQTQARSTDAIEIPRIHSMDLLACEKAENVGGDEEGSDVELSARGVWERVFERDTVGNEAGNTVSSEGDPKA